MNIEFIIGFKCLFTFYSLVLKEKLEYFHGVLEIFKSYGDLNISTEVLKLSRIKQASLQVCPKGDFNHFSMWLINFFKRKQIIKYPMYTTYLECNLRKNFFD